MQGQLGQYKLLKLLHPQAAYWNSARPLLYLAQAMQAQSLQVIKLLSVTEGNIEQDLFLNEIKVLTKLNTMRSCYWLPMLASGQDILIDETAGLKPQLVNYLVLPHIEQGSVRKLLDSQRLNIGEVARLWLDMLDAVIALHQSGWLHLDLKPANFLLKMPCNLLKVPCHASSIVYLIDFALAQPYPRLDAQLSPSNQLIHATKTRGTPRYMSPEQFLGHPLTAQTDFYSLGLVLYELLMGQSVFNASGYQGWVTQHCQHPVPLLPAHLSGVQPLIDGLLAKNPHNRLAKFDEIRQMAQTVFQVTPRL